VKKAALITLIGKYSVVVINLIYTGILSRILSPSEFGVITVMLVFMSFFQVLSEMGIGPAIIQGKNLSSDDNNKLFSLMIIVSLVLGIIFFIFSFILDFIYQTDNYTKLAPLASIALVLYTLNIVPYSINIRKHLFFYVNIGTLVSVIISSIISIVFALNGASYTALMVYNILYSGIILYWNFSKSSLKLDFSNMKASYRKVSKFTTYQLFFSIINYFSRNIDNLIIGRINDPSALGYYDKAYRLSQYPVGYLTHALTPVIHPFLSKHENEQTKIYSAFSNIFIILSFIGVFLGVTSYFISDELILIIFGKQWTNSIRPFQMLSLSIWAQMVTSASGSIFQSLNKTKLLFLTGLSSSTLIIGCILIGVLLGGIINVSLMVSVGYIINLFLVFFILFRFGFNYPYIMFLKLMIKDITIIIALYITLNFTLPYVNFSSVFLTLISKSFISLVTFILLSLLFNRIKPLLKAIKEI
jgi:PST family polysaccharide transporter